MKGSDEEQGGSDDESVIMLTGTNVPPALKQSFLSDCLALFRLQLLDMPIIDGKSCMYAALARAMQLEDAPLETFKKEREGSDITEEQQRMVN